jgi:hypothetical protein
MPSAPPLSEEQKRRPAAITPLLRDVADVRDLRDVVIAILRAAAVRYDLDGRGFRADAESVMCARSPLLDIVVDRKRLKRYAAVCSDVLQSIFSGPDGAEPGIDRGLDALMRRVRAEGARLRVRKAGAVSRVVTSVGTMPAPPTSLAQDGDIAALMFALGSSTSRIARQAIARELRGADAVPITDDATSDVTVRASARVQPVLASAHLARRAPPAPIGTAVFTADGTLGDALKRLARRGAAQQVAARAERSN